MNYSDPSGLAPCTEAALETGDWYSREIDGGWWCVPKQTLQTVTVIAGSERGVFLPFGYGRGMAASIPYVPGTGGGFDTAARSTISHRLVACAKERVGITTAVGAGAVVAGLPIIEKPFSAGGSGGTSIASKGLARLLPWKLSGRIWAPTTRNFLATTTVVGRAAGRWVPLLGWALLADDGYSIGSCVSDSGGSGTF